MTFQEKRNKGLRRLQAIALLLVPLTFLLSIQWGQGIGLSVLVIGIIALGVKSRKISKCPHCGANSYRPYPGGLLAKWHVLTFCSVCGRDFNLPVEKNRQGRISGRSEKA